MERKNGSNRYYASKAMHYVQYVLKDIHLDKTYMICIQNRSNEYKQQVLYVYLRKFECESS